MCDHMGAFHVVTPEISSVGQGGEQRVTCFYFCSAWVQCLAGLYMERTPGHLWVFQLRLTDSGPFCDCVLEFRAILGGGHWAWPHATYL